MDKSDSNSLFFKLLMIPLMLTCITLIICIYNINSSLNEYKTKYHEDTLQIMKIIKSNENLTNNSDVFKQQNEKLKTTNKELNSQNDTIKKQVEALKNQINQLNTKINDINNENIELQKSLKKAASVGITPQSYKIYEGNRLEALNTKGKYVGKFLGTAYTPSADECGNNKGITSSGNPIVPGVTVAVDTKHWPYGTIFYIKGLGYTVAMDTGSAIKGKKRFDFAVLDKKFAKQLGQEYYDVYLVKMGDGKINNSTFF